MNELTATMRRILRTAARDGRWEVHGRGRYSAARALEKRGLVFVLLTGQGDNRYAYHYQVTPTEKGRELAATFNASSVARGHSANSPAR
jgi:hypothetical protein